MQVLIGGGSLAHGRMPPSPEASECPSVLPIGLFLRSVEVKPWYTPAMCFWFHFIAQSQVSDFALLMVVTWTVEGLCCVVRSSSPRSLSSTHWEFWLLQIQGLRFFLHITFHRHCSVIVAVVDAQCVLVDQVVLVLDLGVF